MCEQHPVEYNISQSVDTVDTCEFDFFGLNLADYGHVRVPFALRDTQDYIKQFRFGASFLFLRCNFMRRFSFFRTKRDTNKTVVS